MALPAHFTPAHPTTSPESGGPTGGPSGTSDSDSPSSVRAQRQEAWACPTSFLMHVPEREHLATLHVHFLCDIAPRPKPATSHSCQAKEQNLLPTREEVLLVWISVMKPGRDGALYRQCKGPEGCRKSKETFRCLVDFQT